MGVEIVVLPQLAAGSVWWHEAGLGAASRGKGVQQELRCSLSTGHKHI